MAKSLDGKLSQLGEAQVYSKATRFFKVMNNELKKATSTEIKVKSGYFSKFDLVDDLRKLVKDKAPKADGTTTTNTTPPTTTTAAATGSATTGSAATGSAATGSAAPTEKPTIAALLDPKKEILEIAKVPEQFKLLENYIMGLKPEEFEPPLPAPIKSPNFDKDIYLFPTNAVNGEKLSLDPRRSARLWRIDPPDALKNPQTYTWLLNNSLLFGFLLFGSIESPALYWIGFEKIKEIIKTNGDNQEGLVKTLARFLPIAPETGSLTITTDTVATFKFPVPPTIEIIQGKDFADKVFKHLVSNEGFGETLMYDVGGWRIGSGTNAVGLNPGKVCTATDPYFSRFKGKGVVRLPGPKIGNWSKTRAAEDPTGPWWSHWDWTPENRSPASKHDSVDWYLVYVNLDTGEPMWELTPPRIKKTHNGKEYNIPFMAFDFANANNPADPFGKGSGGGAVVTLAGHRIMWYPNKSTNSWVKGIVAKHSKFIKGYYKQDPNGNRAYIEEDFEGFQKKGWTTNAGGQSSNEACPAWENFTPEAKIALIEICYGFGSIDGDGFMRDIHAVKMNPESNTLQLAEAFRKNLCSDAAVAKEASGDLGYSAKRHMRATMLMEVSAGKAPKEGEAGIKKFFGTSGHHGELGNKLIEIIKQNNLTA